MAAKKAPTSSDPTPDANPPALRFFLGLACFLSGAGIMVVELAGNRLITPLFGNTLYTWTGLISVILVAIAVGDYIGGWLVDRKPSVGGLAWLFGLSAILTVLALPIFELLKDKLFAAGFVVGPLLATLVLFALPACVLAAVSPFTVRLLSRTSADQHIGLSAGTVGALATLGSFFGTLGTGLYLVPTFSLRAIFIGCAIGLLLVAGLAWLVFQRTPRPAGAVLIAFLVGTGILFAVGSNGREGAIHHVTSFYHDIFVVEKPLEPGKTARLLSLDTTLEGGQVVETGELLFNYQKFWQLASALTPGIQNALFLGGGGFGMPQQLTLQRPDLKIEVAELDPQVIDTGVKFFRLGEYPSIKCIPGDARRYLKVSNQRYGLIFGDAYSGVNSVPSHLLSREFFTSVRDHLTDEGIFMMNLISVIRGPNNGLFASVYATLKDVFPNVRVFGVEDPYSLQLQNLILIGSNHDLAAPLQALGDSPNAEIRKMVSFEVELLPRPGAPVLTDDRNRAEWLAATQLRKMY